MEFRSAIGSRTTPENTGMKRFTVDDATISPEEALEMRRQKVEAQNKASPNVKKQLELRLGIGRVYKDVLVNDGEQEVTFTVRTLKGYETRQLLRYLGTLAKGAKENDDSSSDLVLALRTFTLVLAIHAVDGVDFDQALGCYGQDDEIRYDQRAAFIEELDDAVINYVYAEYEIMNQSHKDKYTIKTDEQAKEVAQEIKKSSQ